MCLICETVDEQEQKCKARIFEQRSLNASNIVYKVLKRYDSCERGWTACMSWSSWVARRTVHLLCWPTHENALRMVFHEATSKSVNLFPKSQCIKKKKCILQRSVLVSATWKGDGQENGAINIMLMNSRTDLSSEESHLNKNSFCITPRKEA